MVRTKEELSQNLKTNKKDDRAVIKGSRRGKGHGDPVEELDRKGRFK